MFKLANKTLSVDNNKLNKSKNDKNIETKTFMFYFVIQLCKCFRLKLSILVRYYFGCNFSSIAHMICIEYIITCDNKFVIKVNKAKNMFELPTDMIK